MFGSDKLGVIEPGRCLLLSLQTIVEARLLEALDGLFAEIASHASPLVFRGTCYDHLHLIPGWAPSSSPNLSSS